MTRLPACWAPTNLLRSCWDSLKRIVWNGPYFDGAFFAFRFCLWGTRVFVKPILPQAHRRRGAGADAAAGDAQGGTCPAAGEAQGGARPAAGEAQGSARAAAGEAQAHGGARAAHPEAHAQAAARAAARAHLGGSLRVSRPKKEPPAQV